jgi:hypothetical protein
VGSVEANGDEMFLRGGLDNEGSTSPGISGSSAGFFWRKGLFGLAIYLRIGRIMGGLGRKWRFRMIPAPPLPD